MTSVVNSDSTNRMLNQYRMQINVLTNQLDQYKQAIEFLIEDNKKRKSREKEAIEEKEKIINQFRFIFIVYIYDHYLCFVHIKVRETMYVL